jgi:hypothetical protein
MAHHFKPVRPTSPHLRSAPAPGLAVADWLALQSALVPIVGQGGFAALYQRCLYFAQRDHPWLSAAREGDGDGDALRFEPLLLALSRQPPACAAAAQEQLLRSLLDILANLIGPALVERLLGSVVVVPSNGPSGQDSRS